MIYLLIYIFLKNHMHINLGTFCLRRLVLKYLSSERISICFSQVPEATTNLELLQLNSQTGGFSDHTSGFRCKPLCGTDCGYKFSGFFFFFLPTLHSGLRQTILFSLSPAWAWELFLWLSLFRILAICLISSVRFPILGLPSFFFFSLLCILYKIFKIPTQISS